MVGVLNIKLYFDEVFSLKEKRQIVKSILERLRNRFNVSCAETDLNDVWKNAVITIAYVSNSSSHVDEVLSKVVNFVENDGRCVVEDYSTEKIY